MPKSKKSKKARKRKPPTGKAKPQDTKTISESQKEQAHAEHESLCSNCGKCCYKKIIVGRTVFITPFPCEYLDTDTNTCTIYDQRHELNPECLNMEAGMKLSAFPEDCGYVPVMAPKKYRPAKDDWDWTDEWEDFDDLADDLDVTKEVREIVRARGPLAEPMWVAANERIQREREAAEALEKKTKQSKAETGSSSKKKTSEWTRTQTLIEFAKHENKAVKK